MQTVHRLFYNKINSWILMPITLNSNSLWCTLGKMVISHLSYEMVETSHWALTDLDYIHSSTTLWKEILNIMESNHLEGTLRVQEKQIYCLKFVPKIIGRQCVEIMKIYLGSVFERVAYITPMWDWMPCYQNKRLFYPYLYLTKPRVHSIIGRRQIPTICKFY